MSHKLRSGLLRREPGLRLVRLGGTPRELGQAHGQLLASEIREMRRGILRYLAKLTLWAGGLPLYGALAALAGRFRTFVPRLLWEEMQGVAAGARVELSLILVINVLDDLAQNLPRCSAFAASGRRSRTGTCVMGRNLDYALFTEELTRLQTIFLFYPEQGIPLVSLAWPGYIAVCTGLSQNQVALAQLAAMTRDRTLQGCPSGIRNRQALEQGNSLSEVVRLITASPRTSGNNLLLCDPQEAMVLEVSAHHWARRLTARGLLVATNHYQTLEMLPRKGRFPPCPPFSPLSPEHFTEDYSFSRNRRLEEVAQAGPIGFTEARRMLGDPQVANPGTVTSVVFQPADLSLWLAQSVRTPVTAGRWWRLTNLFSDSGPEFRAAGGEE